MIGSKAPKSDYMDPVVRCDVRLFRQLNLNALNLHAGKLNLQTL